MAIYKFVTTNGKVKWEVRYHVHGRGSKRVRRRFNTKADAEAHVYEQKIEEQKQMRSLQFTGSFVETSLQTEAEYWLRIKGDLFSPSHRQRVRGTLSKLLPKYGRLSPDRLHPGLLTQIQAGLLENGLRPASVNRDLEVITTILNFSTKQRRIPYNPSVGFEKLKEIRDDICFWEQEEAKSFLTFADQKYPFGSKERWVYVVYLLGLNTGMRAGEIWGLFSSDLKQSGEVLHIQRQFDRIQKQFRPTKGKENRKVPCNSRLLRELRALRNDSKSSLQTTVFRNREGHPINHDNFKKRKFDQDVQEWEGKKLRFHDLRHTAITLMIGSGLDVKTVQEIAGHRDLKTTMNYAHLLAERIRFAAKHFAVEPFVGKDVTPTKKLRLIKS